VAARRRADQQYLPSRLRFPGSFFQLSSGTASLILLFVTNRAVLVIMVFPSPAAYLERAALFCSCIQLSWFGNSDQKMEDKQMKTRTHTHIICGLATTAILTGLFPSQTEGGSPCPPQPAGTALVTVFAGGFGLDGDLLANTPISGIGDWVPGPSGSGGYVLNSNGTPVNGATTFHLTDLQKPASRYFYWMERHVPASAPSHSSANRK
jgi:hypothetical protein